jgi:hypothetical protein
MKRLAIIPLAVLSLAGAGTPAAGNGIGLGPCVVSQTSNPGPVNIIVTQRGEVGVGCQTPAP